MGSKEFGDVLRVERSDHGLDTQWDLAHALSALPVGAVQISDSTIGHIETGRRMIGPAVFDACARLFEWGPSEFRRMHTLAYRSSEIARHPWHPASEKPKPRAPCLLSMECPHGAGLDEAFVIGWHDGERWHDVNREDTYPVEAWVDAWMYIPKAER